MRGPIHFVPSRHLYGGHATGDASMMSSSYMKRRGRVMRSQNRSYSAPALEKGLDILELLAQRDSAMSLKVIADDLGRSKGEIFRMVTVLLDRGYLTRDPRTDEFILTNRLFELGLKTPRVKDLLTEAVPAMHHLAEECGHSPHLVVIHRGQTVVIASVPGGSDMSFSQKLGYWRTAIDATSGQVIIAFQPPGIRDRLIGESKRLLREPLDTDKLLRSLDGIRKRGHEMHESRDFVGITDICCPVLDAGGNAVASIIVAYVNRHGRATRHAEVLSALKQTCETISAAIA
jgi:DNA-binding IclR family transcriptional regulator